MYRANPEEQWLRCACKVFADTEGFVGEITREGYTCLGCLQKTIKGFSEERKRRFFEYQVFIAQK